MSPVRFHTVGAKKVIDEVKYPKFLIYHKKSFTFVIQNPYENYKQLLPQNNKKNFFFFKFK